MDDLISKRAAVSRISDLLILELKGQRIPTWNEVYNAIGVIPSSPAVPLDKLCEWLAKYIGFPCNYSPIDEEMADYCGDQCEMDDIGCWKKVLSKWMEGLDDHR